jgi:predicted dinucleotide-binding enzyme
VSGHLGHPVIKAFNNIVFQSLLENGRPEGAPGRIALPVAGHPPAARQKVMRLVDEHGFDPVDAGGLEDSWRQQPGTPGYAADLDAPRLKEALAAADRGRLAEYRGKADDAARAFFASQPQ